MSENDTDDLEVINDSTETQFAWQTWKLFPTLWPHRLENGFHISYPNELIILDKKAGDNNIFRQIVPNCWRGIVSNMDFRFSSGFGFGLIVERQFVLGEADPPGRHFWPMSPRERVRHVASCWRSK